ncbi:malto-oligosyltrehalose trehalohydrolase [Halomicronema hongdechloris]
MTLGAQYLGDHRCHFTLWAPQRQQVSVEILAPQPRQLPLEPTAGGYWQGVADQIPPGSTYQFRLDNEITRPDPASHHQPQGVHGPSVVVDHGAFAWADREWTGVPLADYVIYELHVGTFTPEGCFDAIIPRLAELKELGITALELMPVAQFPGDRNWGYDGVYPFAVQHSYGGPEGLKRLVDACHQQGLAVVLDVVYNHFGPEGNYTADFGPYFTDTYRTPWGAAINFDGPHSPGVRQFVVDNIRHWFCHYHIDALRLDAIHAIYDFGAKHILAELQQATQALSQERGRPYYLIAESDLNDVRVIHPPQRGGYGLAAQWSDDFHHCLHTLLTGEQSGYYQDFGQAEQLAKALQAGFVYDWAYSRHRRRYHGSDASDCPPQQFVVCAQNHDQVGNRMLGERLSTLVGFEALKLAAATTVLSPYIPLMFMGEEYGETAPFLYFVSHGDADLIEAVRQGRQREFEAFHLQGQPPDAASPKTVQQSTLNWQQRHHDHHGVLWRFYRQLLQLRSHHPILRQRERHTLTANASNDPPLVQVYRHDKGQQLLWLLNFAPAAASHDIVQDGIWSKCLDSADEQWLGPGATAPPTLAGPTACPLPAHSCVLYEHNT